MRVVIAPDSFKECAPAPAVAAAMAAGVRRALPHAEIDEVPLADGGEGTVAALAVAGGGEMVQADVTGPLGEPVCAAYALLDDGQTAVIEMAAASGLALVPPPRRNPKRTTTYGTGELMRHALDCGAQHLIVGIGGSATNDGGAGMAEALGYRLLNAAGQPIARGGAGLLALATIDTSGAHPALATCRVEAACDVTNPLCGPEGASQVYGPQKGASPADIALLDQALAHFADVMETRLGQFVRDVPGAGAAGGLGAGLLAFAKARLMPGFALIAEALGLRERMDGAAFVLTGEGRLDGQTLHGKVPLGVAQCAAASGVPVVALAGALGPGHEKLYDLGIHAAFAAVDGPVALEEALARGLELITARAEAIARLWTAFTEST